MRQSLVSAGLLLLVAVPAGSAYGQKGSKTTPPPSGTIYYAYQGEVWRIKPDGSERSLELAAGAFPYPIYGEASQYLYGGRRWFLAVAHDPLTMTVERTRSDGSTYTRSYSELFAVRRGTTGPDVAEWIQLTSFGDLYDGDGVEIGQTALWSNEPPATGYADSFISLEVKVLNADGTISRHACRMDVSADMLEGLLLLDAIQEWQPIEPGQQSLTQIGAYSTHDWAPDGAAITFDDVDGRVGVYVRAFDGSVQRITDGRMPAWSPVADPAAQRIAFSPSNAIYTIRPNGTDRLMILDYGVNFGRSRPRWSPDGNYLCASYYAQRSGAYTKYELHVFPAVSRPAVTNITEGLIDLEPKPALGWSSDIEWTPPQ